MPRPDAHVFRPDPLSRGRSCQVCPLPESNEVHGEEAIARRQAKRDADAARVAEAQAAHRRRTGET